MSAGETAGFPREGPSLTALAPQVRPRAAPAVSVAAEKIPIDGGAP